MSAIAIVLFVHWLADFVFQTNWMAQNKSKSMFALSCHVITYGCIFGIFAYVFHLLGGCRTDDCDILLPLFWVLFNTMAHGVIDFASSRATSYLWKKGDVHNFFVVIGFDQFLHITLLLYSYVWVYCHH